MNHPPPPPFLHQFQRPERDPPCPLTDAEKTALKTSTTPHEWAATLAQIKHTRSGQLPPDWKEYALDSGLMRSAIDIEPLHEENCALRVQSAAHAAERDQWAREHHKRVSELATEREAHAQTREHLEMLRVAMGTQKDPAK